jgi:hypothetical protein
MDQTPDELRRELAERRAAIGYDLEAIGDRMSPHRMVERRRAAVSGRMRRMRESVMGAADSVGTSMGDVAGAATGAPDAVLTRAQGSPFAAGLVAFGAGFLAASMFPASRTERRAARRLEPAVESAVGTVRDQASAMAGDVTEHAKESAQQLGDDARQAAERLRSEAGRPS